MKKYYSFLIGLIFLILPSRLEAFSFTSDFSNGFYWSSFPINMRVLATTQIEGNFLASLVGQSKAAWENAVGREIWSIPGSPTISNSHEGNNIRWSNDFSNETGFDSGTTLAVTTRYRVGAFLTKVEIILNGSNLSLRANLNNMLYQTILHELGHTTGLDHSEFFNTVMAASLSGQNNLQSDDSKGMNAVIDETLQRQATGFISPLVAREDSDSNALSCGTVELTQGPGGRGGGFLSSLLIGLLLVIVGKKFRMERLA